MKIDLDKGPAYCGLGDAVTFSWLAEDTKGSADPMELYTTCKTKSSLLSVLGQTVTTDRSNALNPSDAYGIEQQDRGGKPRVEYLRHLLRIQTGCKQPTGVNISDQGRQWAKAARKHLRDWSRKPLVLLFPQTHWKTREYPAAYWVDIAWKLRQKRIAVGIVCQKEDDRFKNTPNGYFKDLSMNELCAFVDDADLIVGNDSLPCHLAGALGKPALALLGPTKPTVFSHSPTVECLQGNGLDCIGCHFSRPFRAACDQQCAGFFSLTPEIVTARILDKVK